MPNFGTKCRINEEIAAGDIDLVIKRNRDGVSRLRRRLRRLTETTSESILELGTG